MKTKLSIVLAIFIMTISNGFSQKNKSVDISKEITSDSIFMTWNKDTPEQEMNDDIKALRQHGVTVSYSNIKRNATNEITAIRVEYITENGSKGSMELDNQKPINTIKIYKQDDEVGFGEPANTNFIANNDFSNGNDWMKQFNLGNGEGNSQSYSFTFPDKGTFGKNSSKIIIQKDGKKPLVIQDGDVVEGGDDYTKEELEDIKKNNKVEHSFGDDSQLFNFGSKDVFGDLQEQMQHMQKQLDELRHNDDGNEANKTKEEMLKAKEEMKKAKEEMEKTTKELKKAKSSLKTQKA